VVVTEYPTSLDESKYVPEVLLNQVFSRWEPYKFAQCSSVYEWLSKKKLEPHQLQHLLEKITDPSLPNLPELMVDYMKRAKVRVRRTRRHFMMFNVRLQADAWVHDVANMVLIVQFTM